MKGYWKLVTYIVDEDGNLSVAFVCGRDATATSWSEWVLCVDKKKKSGCFLALKTVVLFFFSFSVTTILLNQSVKGESNVTVGVVFLCWS